MGDHSGRDRAGAGEDADERLHQLALVVHAWIAGAYETPELRILPVERLLDLLQLALLVFRERHDASHLKPCARHVCGDLHLTYPVLFPEYELVHTAWKSGPGRVSESLPARAVPKVRILHQDGRADRAGPEPAGDLVHCPLGLPPANRPVIEGQLGIRARGRYQAGHPDPDQP